MAYEPQFTISPRLLSLVEAIAGLRERIQGAAVELSWIPALQKDTRTRNVHASAAIEGNPLTLEQVRALEEGRELAASDGRSSREVLSSAILHYRFEDIHPFADGNGRTGHALSLWELYRRGFDSHHIFSVDEYYWEDRPGYYAALDAVRVAGEDLTGWLEYCAEGVRQTLERVWLRVRSYQVKSPEKLVLRPKQEHLLRLLRDHGSMSPAEIWAALAISRQGAMDLLRPLLEAGLVEKVGGKKTVDIP